MRFSASFEELSKALGYLNSILSDKAVDEKLKNVVFLVGDGKVEVAAYNPLTFCRVELFKAEVEEGLDEWRFQLKYSDISKVFGSFSSLYKTKVEGVDFELSGVRIKLTIHERCIHEEDSKLDKDVVFELESPPILSNIEKEITTEFPDNQNMLVTGDLLVYLNSLSAVTQNDSSNSMSSRINFAEDYVFCLSPLMSAFFKNKLPSEFKNISLGYSSVSFLKKMCESSSEEQGIGVSKNNIYLCAEVDGVKAFIRHQPVKVKYSMYVEKKSNARGVVIDRMYFKDVLRRMSSIQPDGKLYILGADNLEMRNDKYNQEVPLNGIKENTIGVQFKFSVPVMEKMILGNDQIFSSDLFMYFVENARGYFVYLQDKTDAWFAGTQVTKV